MFCCIVEVVDAHYLLTGKDGAIIGEDTEQPLLDTWTKTWERGLVRGGGWSTAACLSFIQVRPSVVPFTDVDDLKERIIGVRDEYHFLDVYVEGGTFCGIVCNGPGVAEAWKIGTKPEFFRDKEVGVGAIPKA